MRNIWHIFRREIGNYFTTPVAYVVITLFIIITNVFFFLLVDRFSAYSGQYLAMMQFGQVPPDVDLNATAMIISPLFVQMAIILLFLTPMLTMRLFAEEHQLGTIEMLLTCPVRDLEVILGKFLAAMAVCAVMLGITIAYPIFISFHAGLEMGPIVSGYFGLLLMCSAFVGIGIFFSSLTENQIVAGALTFATLLFLWLMMGLVQTDTITAGLSAFLRETAIVLRFEDFAQGVINLGDAFYFITVAAFGLFLTANVLDSKVH